MVEIVIYTRKFCGFCTAAKNLLNRKKAVYTEYDATFDPRLRDEMMAKAKRSTFPQIFINDQHIGGSDELHALENAGKLDKLLAS